MKAEPIYDLIVVGGGASGCLAAITAAKRGKNVLVLEKNSQIAKKILVTGNGKCNFTNLDMKEEYFHGDSGLVKSMLESFPLEQVLDFFHSIGISHTIRNGYVYPASNQAKAVMTALDYALYKSKVKVITDFYVRQIKKEKDLFEVSNGKETFTSRNLLLATGLLETSLKGVEESAVSLSKALGHSMSPVLPGLCGYYCRGWDFKRLSGTRVMAKICLLVDGQVCGTDTGEIQFNDYGLSGIPVFQLSSMASKALYEKKTVEFSLNFLYDFEREAGLEELSFRTVNFKDPLVGLLPDKLCQMAKETLGKKASPEAYFDLLSDFKVTLLKAREFQYSQICIGGVKTRELKPNSTESKKIPGLYFAGEMIDVDGICGGYNLHWAWATGHFVGSSIA